MKTSKKIVKKLFTATLALLLCIQVMPTTSMTVNAATKTITVAKDGSGNYKKVQDAVNSISKNNSQRVIIYIKNGTYKEKIRVKQNMVAFKGQSKDKVIITYNDHVDVNKDKAYNDETPTVILTGNNFYAENLTFQNTSGQIERANAIKINADRAAFFNCKILGGQDTLYLYNSKGGRAYFDRSLIEGDVDFIYGAMIAVFNKCEIKSNDKGYVTAASTPQNQAYGYMFDGCKFTGNVKAGSVYLGRPWRDYASVLVKNSSLGAHISPLGWNNWGKPEREKTVRYMEYNNSGVGANTSKRVRWCKILNSSSVASYTADNYLKGFDNWNYKGKVN